jgi:ATP-dependent exoDNAse (exonuclease V) beta subunit
MSKNEWTEQQVKALNTTEDVLLQASAGTGKTQTVVGKIMWMLGLDPGTSRNENEPIQSCLDPCGIHEIAAITFTKSGARDLKRKLRKMLQEHPQDKGQQLSYRLDEAFVGTIHQFCSSILREHSLHLRIDPNFRTLDAHSELLKQSEIIEDEIFDNLENKIPETEALVRVYEMDTITRLTRDLLKDIRWHRKRYKDWDTSLRAIPVPLPGLPPDEYLTKGLYMIASSSLAKWESHLANNNEKDFDQLILETRSLLIETPDEAMLRTIRERYKILIIDEFQDTDHAQKDIALAIAGRKSKTQLFLVGDPQQSIYGFRNADIAVWNEMKEMMRGHGDILSLTENFRSDPKIIDTVNEVCDPAMTEYANSLKEKALENTAVTYQPMVAHKKASSDGLVGKIILKEDGAASRRVEEGSLIGKEIRKLVDNKKLEYTYNDIAILYQTRSHLEKIIKGLRKSGIPCQRSSLSSDECKETMEIVDLLNFLGLLHNPHDDYRALGFLRSPFVGIRDEVITKIRMTNSGNTLINQADKFAAEEAWPDYSDQPAVVRIEQFGLKNGLEAFRTAQQLVGRISLPELLQRFIRQTGYLNHLNLKDPQSALEADINIRSFLNMVETHSPLNLDEFLSMWDVLMKNGQKIDRILPDESVSNFVTMTTIHQAKGLEWPIVFLIKCDQKPRAKSPVIIRSDESDPPILLMNEHQRGDKAQDLATKSLAKENAEAIRLLYVAMTRAEDKLSITDWRSPKNRKNQGFFHGHLKDANSIEILDTAGPESPQIRHDPVPLDWLDKIRLTELPPMARQIDDPPLQFTTSATEVITRERSELEWKQKYQQGIQVAPLLTGKGGGQLSATIRGDLIHGVLEKIQAAEELPRILNEALVAMDGSGVNRDFELPSNYREALEEELRIVLMSPEWKWYVEGEHYRELNFVHLAEPKKWCIGAFDLYRTGSPSEEALVIDFKTHKLEKDEIQAIGETYLSQMKIYREAGEISKQTRVQLHFTVPNATWPKKNVGSTI